MIKGIINNWLAKLVIFLISGALWIFIVSGQSKAIFFPGEIPINLNNIGTGLVATTEFSTVKIKVDIDPMMLKKTSTENFNASADLTNLESGNYKIPVVISSKNPSILIVEKNPSKINVKIEKMISKEVPIQIKTIGTTKIGYIISRSEINPKKTIISGPISLVNQISEANVFIKLSDASNDINTSAPIETLSASGSVIDGINFQPKNASVSIVFSKDTTIKNLGIKIKTINNLLYGYTVSEINITPNVVAVKSDPESLKKLQFLETEPLDLSKINNSTTILSNLVIPSFVTLIPDDKKININVTLTKQIIFRELVVPINLTNLNNNFKIQNIIPSLVSVVVSGPVDSLNSVVPTKIKVNVDGSSLSDGENNIIIKNEQVKFENTDIKPEIITPNLIKIILSK